MKLIHHGIHEDTEYKLQITVDPVPFRYKGRLVWIVAHGETYKRKYNYFYTKREAVVFAKSKECSPHEWGGNIYVFWMPRENAIVVDKVIKGVKGVDGVKL